MKLKAGTRMDCNKQFNVLLWLAFVAVCDIIRLLALLELDGESDNSLSMYTNTDCLEVVAVEG